MSGAVKLIIHLGGTGAIHRGLLLARVHPAETIQAAVATGRVYRAGSKIISACACRPFKGRSVILR
jgi:hypothetical protein